MEWRDPPPRSGRPSTWVTLLMPLVDRPGEWAMVYKGEDARKTAQRVHLLNKRKLRIPRSNHNWEFTSRGGELFARYIGPWD